MLSDNTLYGLSSFKLLRTPPQVLFLCPPLSSFSQDVRNGRIATHPVVREILGMPVHTLVQNRKDRRRCQSVTTHLVESKLPQEAVVKSALDINLCSPLFTLLTLARHLNVIELAMAMYELCGEFSVFKPSAKIEELLQTPEAAALSKAPGAWRRVRSLAKTTSGSAPSLWMRPPLITLDELHRFSETCPAFRGKSNFRNAAKLVTGVTSSPFEVQLSMLLSLPSNMGGKDMPLFTNNTSIPLTKRARGIHSHHSICADLLFEDDTGKTTIDVECQGAIVHDDERQVMSDSDRSTALSAMGIEVLLITYDKITNQETFHSIAEIIAQKLGYPLAAPTEESKRREAELRRHLMIDWATLGDPINRA